MAAPDGRQAPTDGTLAAMMPIYNEEKTLPHILDHVLARPEIGEVIAVDDGSRDRTWEILQEVSVRDPRLRIFRQDQNRGKGAALRRAISELRMPFALVQDADLEYDPADYAALLQPLVSGRADAVFGVRGFAGHTAYSYWFVKGGQMVTWFCNVLYNCYISDLTTGYKVLRSDLWQRLNLHRSGFDMDAEIAAQVIKLGYKIHEVPIRYYSRSRAEGKKVGVRDGLTHLAALVEVKFRSKRALFGDRLDEDYHRRRHAELAETHPLVRRRDPQQLERPA